MTTSSLPSRRSKLLRFTLAVIRQFDFSPEGLAADVHRWDPPARSRLSPLTCKLILASMKVTLVAFELSLYAVFCIPLFVGLNVLVGRTEYRRINLASDWISKGIVKPAPVADSAAPLTPTSEDSHPAPACWPQTTLPRPSERE